MNNSDKRKGKMADLLNEFCEVNNLYDDYGNKTLETKCVRTVHGREYRLQETNKLKPHIFYKGSQTGLRLWLRKYIDKARNKWEY